MITIAVTCEAGDRLLTLADSDVTMAEVAAALDLTPHSICVDGQRVSASARARNVLIAGCSISSSPTDHVIAPTGGAVEVAAVAGLAAGPITTLDAGLHHVGQHDFDVRIGCYLDVARQPSGAAAPWHKSAASIRAVESDLEVFAVSPPIASEVGHAGYLHRPPRQLPPSELPALEVEDEPPPVPPPTPLSWVALLAPLPVALMMALFFRPLFALFAAMGPIAALGRWYEAGRRYRRDVKKRSMHVDQLRARRHGEVAERSEVEAGLRWLRNPHVAELWRRSRVRSVRLWERRPAGQGFLCVTIGIGTDEAVLISDDVAHLRPVPHVVDLAAGTGVGICGSRAQTLAVARSLVLQLASLQGPADLTFGLVCRAEAVAEWDWLKWLPHLDQTLLGTSAALVAKALVVEGPTRLIVIDDDTADVAALHRAALEAGHEVRFIAVADQPTALPAVCSALVALAVGADGRDQAELSTPELTGRRAAVRPTGLSRRTAESWARSLSAVSDPEARSFQTQRDVAVSLIDLVGFTNGDDLQRRWSQRDPTSSPCAPIGHDPDGPFTVDLTADGPHVLVAGTTGSGKSEMLRTLVLALAVDCPPQHLNFVLVDFKGGGAFDAVDRLPHVAGLITDLDEALVVRAVNSLRAELHRREALFRAMGVSSYETAVANATEPIARLVIVIDEFAALATDYADLMSSIIDLAARGRSLGMHLVLATQRPSGVVDQKIRANTNLRVALRVQDAFDSQDVVGIPDAAAIDRNTPGRAIFSVGGDTPVVVQTAYCGAIDRRSQRCVASPYVLVDGPATSPSPGSNQSPSELEVLLDAISSVCGQGRRYRARPLWPEPLPETLAWTELARRQDEHEHQHGATAAVVGLVDLPEQQVQLPWCWDPSDGALVIYAGSARCAAKSVVSLAAALASRHGPNSMHLYVIDGDAGNVGPLTALPHTGAYMTLVEVDRIERTLRFFERTLADRRREADTTKPRLVLMIDNLAAVLSMLDDLTAADMVERLSAVARDGAPQRLHLVITARTARDVSHRLQQQIPNRLVLALADASSYLTLGLKSREVVPLPDMRAIDLSTRNLVQLVEPPDLGAVAGPAMTRPAHLPTPIGTFPSTLSIGELTAAGVDLDGTLRVPLGVEAVDLDQVDLELEPGDHLLITGAPCMGRSTLLQTLAHQLDPVVRVVRVAPSRSPMRDDSLPGELIANAVDVRQLGSSASPPVRTVLLIDDAERIDDEVGQAVAELLAGSEWVHVVASCTPDFARALRTWLAPLRAGGIGVVLGPTPIDSDLFKVKLTAFDGSGSLPGRGYMIDRGRAFPMQFACSPAAANTSRSKV